MKCPLAWQLLKDAHIAADWLEDEDDPARRRILWFAAISILVSISEVMDRDTDKEVRKAIQDARLRWKDERNNVFYCFIRFERNKLNHEGNHGHTDEEPIYVIFEGMETAELENISDVYWPVTSGPYAGLDARDALVHSIEWFRDELRSMGVGS